MSGAERRAALPGGLPPAAALHAQLLSVGAKLFEEGQLGPVASLAALVGPLAEDPAMLFLQVRFEGVYTGRGGGGMALKMLI